MTELERPQTLQKPDMDTEINKKIMNEQFLLLLAKYSPVKTSLLRITQNSNRDGVIKFQRLSRNRDRDGATFQQ